ncbi:MAG TPA: hypothetical protein VKW76_11010 [Candidatus Binatia bacterium]|nr:hypothetical protein [Candidatus Binatia bacterium]
MRIRRFTAATAAAAFREVKAVLGAEAVILETHAVDGGVAVVAATDLEEASSHEELVGEVRALLDVVRGLVAERAGTPAARGELDALHRALVAHGMDGVIATALVSEAAAALGEGEPIDAALARLLGAAVPARADARVRLFVGAPGDGKTTTVAKLAARERAAGREVVVVSADTWRVGARAELEAYGRALGVRVARIAEPGELAVVVRAAPAAARVLVDTAGAGPGEAAVLADVSALAAAAGREAGVTLVASATTSAAAAAEVCRAFAAVAPDACVLTKVDAGCAGPVLGLLWRQGLPVSHLATGRRILDDLEPATPERLARCVLAA